MKGFILGLLVAAVAFGGYLTWKASDGGRAARIGERADAAAATKKRRKSRRAVRLARSRGESVGQGAGAATRPGEPVLPEEEVDPEPEPIRLTAADRKMTAEGDDLGRPEVVRMDFNNDDQLPELSQEDIDQRFRAQEERVLDCIAQARPDAEAYVPGLVNVKFRIQRAGNVRGVRVEAPAILMKRGLYPCVRALIEDLHFPAAGSSQIVSYPFRLR